MSLPYILLIKKTEREREREKKAEKKDDGHMHVLSSSCFPHPFILLIRPGENPKGRKQNTKKYFIEKKKKKTPRG